MFRFNLKSSIATVAVTAGVLAVAGPASASGTPLHDASSTTRAITMLDYEGSPLKSAGNEVGFKSLGGMDSETEFMDYTDDSLLD